CKVDLQGASEIGEGECVALLKDGDESDLDGAGINKIIALDDRYIWTATGTSDIKRWKDIKPREHRARLARQAKREREGKRRLSDPNQLDSPIRTRSNSAADGDVSVSSSQLFGLTAKIPKVPSSESSPTSRRVNGPQRSVLQQHRPSISVQSVSFESDVFQLPIESLVSLAPPADLDPMGIGSSGGAFTHTPLADPDIATLYSSNSARSIATSLLPAVVGGALDGNVAAHLVARQNFEDREIAAEAIPLRLEPDAVIEGSHGLMKVEMLNDRRHVLSVDTQGTVALWDIAHGECVGVYDSEELLNVSSSRRGSADSSSGSGNHFGSELASQGKEALRFVKERIEGEGTTTTFCTVDCRTGRLSVHLEESRCFDAEVYADECGLDPSILTSFKDDQRLIMGKWILRNLFRGFIEQEFELKNVESAEERLDAPSGLPVSDLPNGKPRPRHISLHNLNSNSKGWSATTPGMTIGLATPAPTPALPPDSRLLSSPIKSQTLSPKPPTMNLRGLTLPPIAQSPSQNQGQNESNDDQTPHSKDSSSRDYFSYPVASPTTAKMPSLPLGPEPPNSPTPPKSALTEVSSSTSPKTPAANLPSQPANLSFMGRLKSFGGRKKQQASESQSETSNVVMPENNDLEIVQTPDIYAHLSESERQQMQMLNLVLSKPFAPLSLAEVPPIIYEQDMSISIEEETSESGAWVVVYRGLTSSTKRDAAVLEMISPQWLLEALLGGRHNVKDPAKVSFVLNPLETSADRALPALPNGNTRLTANKILRVKKIAAYVAEKLNLAVTRRSRQSSLSVNGAETHELVKSASDASMQSTASKSKDDLVPPEELIELTCAGEILSAHMTLGSVKQFIFRQGSDVVIFYRLRETV
ncbi:hypothetical protein BT69DRAFT_390505, partial [Atractiella rhizophila]